MITYCRRLAALPLILLGCAGNAGGVKPASQNTAIQQCAAQPEHPYFEFQVESPARRITDAVRTHPLGGTSDVKIEPGSTDVQFVVDTAGHPVGSTLKMLRTPSNAVSDKVRSEFMDWRFKPARIGSCPVPQLVQISVIE